MKRHRGTMIERYDVTIAPACNPLEQLTLEVDAVGVEEAEVMVYTVFKGQAVIRRVTAHREQKINPPTFTDWIQYGVRRVVREIRRRARA